MILREMYPGHPLLLPSYFEADRAKLVGGYARKPLLGREGNNVTLSSDGVTVLESAGGGYGGQDCVYQQYVGLPVFPNPDNGEPRYPIVGSWVVGETPVGIGIRESTRRITDNLASFVPHFIQA